MENVEKLNGYIMSGDTPVAKIVNNNIVECDGSRCPLILRDSDNVVGWLKSRAADNSRINIRLIKKALGLKKTGDLETALHFNAVTVTDNFWFKNEGSEQTWEDVKFKSNDYASLALNGDIGAFLLPKTRTPELTNIGSFEKCWKLEDGKWWLFKKENDEQRYCEYFIYRVGSGILGFDMAKYEIAGKDIKSLDFTQNNKYNLEHLSSIMGDNEDYNCCFTKLYDISPNLAKEYLKIIYLDTLCQNYDRHTNNLGLLRDPDTGEIIKMAPNYDNNVALIVNGTMPNLKNLGFDEFFIDFLNTNEKALSMFKEIEISTITMDLLKRISDRIDTSVDKDAVNSFVVEHQRILKGRIDNLAEQKLFKEKIMDDRSEKHL